MAWIRTEAPGSKDRDILQRAVSEQRVLLTFDKDFGASAKSMAQTVPVRSLRSSVSVT